MNTADQNGEIRTKFITLKHADACWEIDGVKAGGLPKIIFVASILINSYWFRSLRRRNYFFLLHLESSNLLRREHQYNILAE